jgi:hypothetical protein
MRSKRWQPWVAACVAAGLAVIGIYLVADWLGREPPNYSRIEDGLYLGGHVGEPPRNTEAVLNLCETEDPYRAAAHRWEPIHDGEPVPSLDWLRQQVEFIAAERKAGRVVFVHCRNGVSRSGMVVTAYLMAEHGWSRDQALAVVRSRRDIVRPNPAFTGLLLEWEDSLQRGLKTGTGTSKTRSQSPFSNHAHTNGQHFFGDVEERDAMTEGDWLTAADPQAMLTLLRKRKVSPRKARLFCVAAVRQVWPLVNDDRSRKTLEVAERFADGAATETELVRARTALRTWALMARRPDSWFCQRVLNFMHRIGPSLGYDSWTYDIPPTAADVAIIAAVCDNAVKEARTVLEQALEARDDNPGGASDATALGAARLCDLVRDVFGNPFRRPAVLCQCPELVRQMATDIYNERTFEYLPVLADALEEAGCSDAAVLGHLRSAEPHYRGCYALDVILQKE